MAQSGLLRQFDSVNYIAHGTFKLFAYYLDHCLHDMRRAVEKDNGACQIDEQAEQTFLCYVHRMLVHHVPVFYCASKTIHVIALRLSICSLVNAFLSSFCKRVRITSQR